MVSTILRWTCVIALGAIILLVGIVRYQVQSINVLESDCERYRTTLEVTQRRLKQKLDLDVEQSATRGQSVSDLKKVSQDVESKTSTRTVLSSSELSGLRSITSAANKSIRDSRKLPGNAEGNP